MRIPKQLNPTPIVEDAAWPDWFRRFLDRYVAQAKRVVEALPGPTLFNLAAVTGPAHTVSLRSGDVVAATLIADVAITIPLTRAGDEGMLELTQDGTGGHAVTWVNVVWSNATPPVVAATAGKRTLLGFTNLGAEWVGRVIASNF